MCLEGKSSTCGSNLSSFEESTDAENNDLEFCCCCCSSGLRHVLAKEAVVLRRNMAAAAGRDMSRMYVYLLLCCLSQTKFTTFSARLGFGKKQVRHHFIHKFQIKNFFL